MTIKELKVLKARIREELTNIQELLRELEKKKLLVGKDKRKINLGDDSFTLRAIGSVLHDFYVGVENVFELIGREIDESTPAGQEWHVKILKQMSLEIPDVRPAVISKDTLYHLDKYRAFRHVFRNVYGFNLDGDRLKELLEILPDAAEMFTQDLIVFIDKVERISKE